MELHDVHWAIRVLEERAGELSDSLPRLRRAREPRADVIREVEEECLACHKRCWEILESVRHGKDVDLHHEFAMLCEDIEFLTQRSRKSAIRSVGIHAGISTVSAATATVFHCLAGVEAGLVALLSILGTTGVRIGHWTKSGETHVQRTERIASKKKTAAKILQSTYDIRYRSSAIEHLGMQQYHYLTQQVIG